MRPSLSLVWKRAVLTVVVVLWALGPAWRSWGEETVSEVPRAKNVIIMVADGAGFNTWRATSMYRGQLGKEIYDQPGWIALAASTHPLTTSSKPRGKGEQDEAVVYSPRRAWDREKGYGWLRSSATDSAAAATAMATGVKTYNNAINWDDLDKPLRGRTLPEIAHQAGKSAGVVTSVQWSHATPAGLGGAHNRERDNYAEIAAEMLAAPYLQVIMGAGHPEYDNNGRKKDGPPDDKDCRYVGGLDEWRKLVEGIHPGGWKLVQTKAEFEKLMEGPTPPKVIGVAQVATTLQQGRGGLLGVIAKDEPFGTPFNDNVPTLATMAAGAINVLDDNPKGFYLMIEGGAVDWANHANQLHRMIEEQSDFLAAVETVVRWVEEHSSWNETLLILTADHECGLLWGPNSHETPFDPIRDQGLGKMPAARYNATGHTNSLVPLYARGMGAELFRRLIKGKDPQAAEAWGISGEYVDNTDIFRVAHAVLTGQSRVP